MKVTMLAIVLLVASVIVLIFANTLNSWVLGGLIGGLAALLISIPISLIIFTSLARQHDERLFAQMAEDAENDEIEEEEYTEVYETEAYLVPQEQEEAAYYLEDEYYDEDGYQYENVPTNRTQDRRNTPGQTRQSPHVFQQPRRDGRHTGHQRQPRAGQTTRSLRSQQHTAALRTAMREAEQELLDQGDVPASRHRAVTPRRQLAPKSRLHRSDQEQASLSRARTRPDKQPSTSPLNQQRGMHRAQRTGDLRTTTRQRDESRYSPDTGPAHSLYPDTGKIERAPQPVEEYDTTERWTGALNNPIVRRAPYLYEDDPLHEHFAQQVDKPVARRSSRHLQP